ncbi:MAG: AEC family transporter [Candidatus Omnitrophica bacterium]|nr:AEC family transporter [Candidatus Omnitrophota bacterium]
MLIESFKITGIAVAQSLLLAAIGFLLIKKLILSHDELDGISRLVMKVTLPLLIFCQLIKDFDFHLYPNWWIFPLISVVITIIGLLVGFIFIGFIKGLQRRLQFLSLSAFQNSGYLPLVLIAALLPNEQAGPIYIYLFLFLLGFNLVMFSAGVYMLLLHEKKKFELSSIFSAPVVATLIGMGFVFFGWQNMLPDALIKPLRLTGECTVPLAMIVVGGSLAEIKLAHIERKAMFLMVLSKLVILPALGLTVILKLRLPELIGLLILMQLAMPPATSLSVIIRHFKKEDLYISQGIFIGHVVSIITIPIFLSIYFALVMIK